MQKRNRTVAVIGAGDFIGGEIAKKFASEGFTIFAGRRNGDKLAPLVTEIEAMGGVRRMFLTHRDDIADHARFAEKFGAERIMHAADGAARHGIVVAQFPGGPPQPKITASQGERAIMARTSALEAGLTTPWTSSS